MTSGNPKQIASLADTCGIRGVAGLGTAEETLLRKTSDACVAAGKPALDIATYPDKPSGMRLVQTGRADLMLSDGGFVGNVVKTNGSDFAKAFLSKTGHKVGPGVTRSSPTFSPAIIDALEQHHPGRRSRDCSARGSRRAGEAGRTADPVL